MFGTDYLRKKVNKVIVIGGDHHNTLGVIRGLGERGLKPDVILVTKEKRSFVDASKYINRSWKVKSEEQIVELLKEHYKQEKVKPVLICCSDATSGIVDDNRDSLDQLFYLPGAEQQGRVSEFMDKKQMADLAIKSGLNIPRCYYINSLETDITLINTPCIVKPIVSRKGGKSDIAICRTISDLEHYAASHTIEDKQIQDYIDKDFEYQLIGCSTKSEVIIPGVSKILRPCKGSNTSFLHYTEIDKNFCEIEKCKEFVRRTGYHGLFSLEFLRDKQGKDYFMEINFRNDGNAICVTAAGMSLPYIWYLDCIGSDYSDERNKLIKSVYVMPDMAEFKLLVTRQISVKEYISDLRKTNRFMEFDKRDPKPFWKLLLFHVCSRINI